MDYHNLNDFINAVAGGWCNVQGDNFFKQCNHLCKQHNIDDLKLLSVIQQKMNGDMIVRLNRSPVFNDKLQSLMGEWGIEGGPLDLFRCPNDCYDSTKIGRIIEAIKLNDDDYSKLNDDLTDTDTDSGLYEMMEGMREKYHNYDEDVQRELVEIGERRNEYNPNPDYRDILCDLSTKPKSFYLDRLLDDKGNDKMKMGVNRRIDRGIPENIHMIFLNSSLIPILMAKRMENHRSKCMGLKKSLGDKHKNLEDVMERIGPSEPFSDKIRNLLAGLTTYLEEPNGDLPSDDEEDPAEDQIKGVIDALVKKSFDDKGEKDEEDEEDEEVDEDEEMHHLKIEMDKADKETELNGGGLISTFF